MQGAALRARQALIIGVVLLLTACSTVRLAYNTAPQLVWWWLDGYVDFASENSARVKDALAQWLAWHRHTQLLDYAALLERTEPQLAGTLTPAQVCDFYAQTRTLLQSAIDHGVVMAAELLPALGAAQLEHLETKLAKKNEEFRKDRVKLDASERRKERLKRAVDSAERLYGRLEEAQRAVLEAASVTGMDGQAMLAERERRQRDMLQTLRRWQAQPPDRAAAQAGLRDMVQQMEVSSDPAYRAIQLSATENNCRVSADVHNSASPRQREAARKQFKAWESDLRALAAAK